MKPPYPEFRNSYVSGCLERPEMNKTPYMSEGPRETALSTSLGEHKALGRCNIHSTRDAKAHMLWIERIQGDSFLVQRIVAYTDRKRKGSQQFRVPRFLSSRTPKSRTVRHK